MKSCQNLSPFNPCEKQWVNEQALIIAIVITGMPAVPVVAYECGNDENDEEDKVIGLVTENMSEDEIIVELSDTQVNNMPEYLIGEDVREEINNEEKEILIASGKSNEVYWKIDSNGLLTVSGKGDWERNRNKNNNIPCAPWYGFEDSIINAKVELTDATDLTSMFLGCVNLINLDLNGLDTSNVTDMTYMFAHCSSLTRLDVSNFDTSSVERMVCMFSGCSGLTELDVSNFDTSNVTDMWHMFSGCRGLTDLDVSNFDTSNVKIMGSMFEYCSGLTRLDVSNFDTSNVTDMWHMFSGCRGLTDLDVSSFDTSSVQDMYGMFSGCSGLTELDVSGFHTKNVVLMDEMFQNCNNLTSLNMKGFNFSSVQYYSNMFYGCSSLIKMIIPIGPYFYDANIELPNTFKIKNGTKYKNLSKEVFNNILIREDIDFDNLPSNVLPDKSDVVYRVTVTQSENGIISPETIFVNWRKCRP